MNTNDKHEVSIEQVGGRDVPSDRTREVSLEKAGLKFRVGVTAAGHVVAELSKGFERDVHCINSVGGNEGALYNVSLDALEALILAHVCEGIDVASIAYQNGILTALDAIANNY